MERKVSRSIRKEVSKMSLEKAISEFYGVERELDEVIRKRLEARKLEERKEALHDRVLQFIKRWKKLPKEDAGREMRAFFLENRSARETRDTHDDFMLCLTDEEQIRFLKLCRKAWNWIRQYRTRWISKRELEKGQVLAENLFLDAVSRLPEDTDAADAKTGT